MDKRSDVLVWFGIAMLLVSATGCGGSQAEPQSPHASSGAAAPDTHPTSQYDLAKGAPADRPFGTTAAGTDKLNQMIAPLVQKARETYPSAKRRFLAGLPSGEVFFVTARLQDDAGHFEQAFIHVEGITGDVISGTIASDINLVRGFRHGDHFELKEAALVDWLISKPDGSEEGNLVGKFLDTLQR
jgi:hypothetical protein